MYTCAKYTRLLPSLGFISFMGLFFYASIQYPGGSIFDKNTPGFDWVYNFWCDLMRSPAYNGSVNTSMHIGVAAMFVLCASFIGLFLLLPLLFPIQRHTSIVCLVTCIDIVVCSFVFTSYHEQIIWIGGLLSIVPIIWTVYHLKVNNELNLLFSGAIVAFLLFLNFILFAMDRMWFILPLPLIEKIALVALLIWAMGVNYRIVHKTI
jgi:hypothetical protein